MVFGWKKKKPSKQEAEESVSSEKEISFSDIPTVLDEIKSLRTKTIITEAKSFRKNMEPQRQEILKIANELERDDLKVEDIDKHLQILVIRGKKLVISTIQKEASESLPEISSYDDISALNTQISQMLKRIGDVLGRQSRVIHIFAKKYASKLKEHLALLNSQKEELQKLVINYTILNSGISYILEKIDSYQASQKSLDENNNRLDSLTNSIKQYEKSLEFTKHTIEKLKSTNEYAKFLEIKKELEKLSNEENLIKNQVDTQFTKISRPLNKYGYISSLEKPQKKLLEHLENNPFDVLTSSKKDDIVQILYAVRRGVEAGSVSVKDSNKSVNQIDETIRMLDNFLAKITNFMERKNDLENSLDIFDIKKLNQEETNLTKTMTDKEEAESKIQKIENQTEEIRKSLPSDLMDIEEKLRRVSNTKYHISI